MSHSMTNILCEDNIQINSDSIAETDMITKNDITVTEKDKSEQPDHEELFHIIASSAQDAILMLNEVGNITFWNEAAERIFGYTREEIIGQNMHAILPPMPYREAYIRAFQHFQQTGHGAAIGKTLELSALRKDGSEFPLELSLSAVRVNNTWHSIGIVRDITTHKDVLKTLQNALEFKQVLMDAIPSPIFFKDQECNYTGGNKAFEQYIGISKEQFIGKSVFDIFPPQLAEKYYMFDREMFNNPGISSYETSVSYADGTLHDVIFQKSTFLDLEGNLAGLIGILVDITEKNALEKQLKKNIDELIAANLDALVANRCKSDFLANMSHELHTPLNSVIGFSEVLLDELFGPLNEQQKEYTENILYGGKHLLSLINDIIDLAKVESGKMELELDTFSLQETLNTSLLMFKEKAQKAQVELNLEIATQADVEITADQRKLKQIIFHLLSNAIKFTQAGGSVNVQTSMMKDDGGELSNSGVTQPSSLNSQHNRNFIEISVEDTGIGIKTEDVSKLFKAFTQLESPYTKKYKGTGTGLVLSRELVELHGGRICVKSEFGTGSRFSFTIPLRQEVLRTPPVAEMTLLCD